MNPPVAAIATPSTVPINCDMNDTPPMPPRLCRPKIPAATPPQAPHNPCKGHTPSTSSIFHLFCVSVNIQTKMAPAIAPVSKAPIGCIRSDPAQTATKPANKPKKANPGSFLPSRTATSVPPTIAINELIATSPFIFSSVCALITIKPNQPTVRSRLQALEKECSKADARPSRHPWNSGHNAHQTTTPQTRQPNHQPHGPL